MCGEPHHTAPAYLPPHDINNRPPPYLALVYRAKMPNFPKIWAFEREFRVYTHGMPRAGTRHANGAVMTTITATPPASCTACLYSPTTTTLGKKISPTPLFSAPLSSKKPKISQNMGVARGISCVYTHGMQRAGARHANGAVMATITATPPEARPRSPLPPYPGNL